MKFNHLNVPTHWRNYWTRYPEGHTILEALISWVSQVDSMVDNQNTLNDNVAQFRNEIDAFVGRFDDRLQDEVTEVLSDWQNSGFLDVVISEALQWQLTDYIATNEADKLTLTAQLHQTEQSLNAQLAQIEILKAKNKYGLIGDGIADDTIGLQRYINDSVEQGYMYVPFGTYRFTKTLVIPDGIRIVGEKGKTNKFASILLYDGEPDTVAIEAVKKISGEPVSFWGLAIEYIALVNNKWEKDTQDFGRVSTGIKLNIVSEGYFNNFQVTGFKVGILSKQANICDFNKCYITHNQYGIWLGYYDLNRNILGYSEMNVFNSLNFWNNETHVVLGGEANFFNSPHMEQAKNVFLLNSKYAPSCNAFECSNANIRNGDYGFTDHTNSRLLNIVEHPEHSNAVFTKLKFSFSNIRLTNSDNAIEVDFINDLGAKAVEIILEDMDIYGVNNIISSDNFSYTEVAINGRARFKKDFAGGGDDAKISSTPIKLFGIRKGVLNNVINGSINLGVDYTGDPSEADVWFDRDYNIFSYHDGEGTKRLEQIKVGTTAERPSTLFLGRQYFDTTINKLVVVNGSWQWVDAMGNLV